MEKHKHLDCSARVEIENYLKQGLSFKEIGRRLEKDPSTISKEVRGHIQKNKNDGYNHKFNNCIHRKECKERGGICKNCVGVLGKTRCNYCGLCINVCKKYEPETCTKLSKPPYVCNGCPDRKKCSLEKSEYIGWVANKEYLEQLSSSRSGFNLTEEEVKQLDGIISPLLKQGQSLHHICVHNADEIMYSEKSLYAYANASLFEARNIDMPRKVRLRSRKKKSTELKVDKKCRENRTYEDFKKFVEEHPNLPISEIDSVEGTKGGAVLLTIYFRLAKLQLAIRRDSNDSKSVTDFFNYLYTELGPEEYGKLFGLVLGDNGSEFSNPAGIERVVSEDVTTHLFYCDPSAPGQKGGCEFNHEFIRRIIPKGKDLTPYSQEQITLMMSHINSYSRPDLGDKSPIEMFEFLYPNSKLLTLLGIKKIAPNDIILSPKLFENK